MAKAGAATCEVAVIGAGPYGLSVAAHLKQAGIATQVFGEPMGFWRYNMPKGMMLRSPWRATHLSDPEGALSLDAYSSQQHINTGKPLPVEQFVAYGEWFQKRAVPEVDRRAVRLVDLSTDCFRLTLADGESLSADRVVIATGLVNQDYWPPVFHDLPSELVTHTSRHASFSQFRGKRIAVIGRGQSACESAALLAEAGASVEIISRGAIHWLDTAENALARKPLRRRLREVLASPAEIGPFPLSWLVEVPSLVRCLPESSRDEFTRRCLRPAAAGWLLSRFADVTCSPRRTITAARQRAGHIELELDDGTRTFDHVLLGSGYRVDITRIGILASQVLERIDCADGSPLLGNGFESSLPKLHFVGSYAVGSFGPLLRFIAGTFYAARSVTSVARRGSMRKAAGKFAPPSRIFDTPILNLSPPR